MADKEKSKLIKMIEDAIEMSGITSKKAEDTYNRIAVMFHYIDKELVQDLIDKYKIYLFHKRIILYKIDEKFQGDKAALDFDTWIFRRKWEAAETFPKTGLTEYIFGDIGFEKVYNKFLEVDKKLKRKRNATENKFFNKGST